MRVVLIFSSNFCQNKRQWISVFPKISNYPFNGHHTHAKTVNTICIILLANCQHQLKQTGISALRSNTQLNHQTQTFTFTKICTVSSAGHKMWLCRFLSPSVMKMLIIIQRWHPELASLWSLWAHTSALDIIQGPHYFNFRVQRLH